MSDHEIDVTHGSTHRRQFEMELARVSSQRLRPLSRSVEAQLPSSRSERLSLFPGWESSDRAELLNEIVGHLDGRGLRARLLLLPRQVEAKEIATGAGARDGYLAAASRRGSAWPTEVLVWSDGSDGGVAMASDLDATTFFMDSWGADARTVCDDVFELVWRAVRGLH